MSVTPIGLVLIPLSLLIFWFRPDYLAPWAIVVAAFQAAAVITIGGGFPIGVGPYFFVLVLIAIRFVPQWLTKRIGFARNDPALHLCHPLLLLTLWGTLSAFLLPVLFAGTPVDTPRAGMDRMLTVPLQWSMSNAAQAGYLVLNCVFFLQVLWQSQHYDHVERLLRAFLWSGVVVALVGIYQATAHVYGLPYPDTFFNSNLAWRQLFDQDIAGTKWWRLSATFNEPSGAGAFFATWSALPLFLATHPRTTSLYLWLCLGCGIVMLFLTVSTTGYVAGAALILIFAAQEVRSLFRKHAISRQSLVAYLVVLFGSITAAILLPDLQGVLAKIIFSKGQTASAHARGATIWEAIRIAGDSWGLGVGLGSNRPSGVLFYIASNLGLPGIALIGFMIFLTRRIFVFAKESLSSHHPVDGYLIAAGWAFATELLVMLTSGTDISSPHLWVVWALVAGLSRYTWIASHHVVEVSKPTIELAGLPSASRPLIVLDPSLRAEWSAEMHN